MLTIRWSPRRAEGEVELLCVFVYYALNAAVTKQPLYRQMWRPCSCAVFDADAFTGWGKDCK